MSCVLICACPSSTGSRQLAASPPRLPRVLVLTTFESDDLVLDAIAASASGYPLKRARPEELTDAIREVAAGEAALAPSVARRVIHPPQRIPHFAQAASTPTSDLTAREHEILGLVAQSLPNAEIAERLVLSEATVKSRVKRIWGVSEMASAGIGPAHPAGPASQAQRAASARRARQTPRAWSVGPPVDSA
jgi:DNA-binding NarL/FixJ family response regulator